MTIWEILEIEQTRDQTAIKRAYAKIIKKIDQATQAAYFQQVREAYEHALVFAREGYVYYENQVYIEHDEDDDADDEMDDTIEDYDREDSSDVEDDTRIEDDSGETDYLIESDTDDERVTEQENDQVDEDIQRITELIEGSEAEAIGEVERLLASDRYESLINREKFETKILFFLYYDEPLPYVFANRMQQLFEWGPYENPFPNDYQLAHIYAGVVKEIARQRTISEIKDRFNRYNRPGGDNGSSFDEIADIIFGDFDEETFAELLHDPDRSVTARTIFNYIGSQNYHPQEMPISQEAMEWWYGMVQEVGKTYREEKTGSSSGKLPFWLIIFLILMAIRGFSLLFDNTNKYNSGYDQSQYMEMKDRLDKLRLPAGGVPSEDVYTDVQGRFYPNIMVLKAYEEKNYARVLILTRPHADRNNASALRVMAELYKNGLGVKKNEAKAAGYYERAAVKGDLESQINLAIMYEKGLGVKKDPIKRAYWIKLAADQNDNWAQNVMGSLLLEGKGIKKDTRMAIEYLTKSAQQGNANAQNNLGVVYMDGNVVRKDYVSALKWLKQAAKQQHLNAYMNIGIIYQQQDNPGRDLQESIKWFRQAAKLNDPQAMANLGYLYSSAAGKHKDFKQAVHWYKQAAAKGNSMAQNNLAVMYFDGSKIEKDHSAAFRLWQRAAKKQHELAQLNLARCYLNGIGVERDLTKAMVWFKKSAEQGNAEAHAMLQQLRARQKEERPERSDDSTTLNEQRTESAPDVVNKKYDFAAESGDD